MSKPTVINATLFWPNLAKRNDMSGKYQVDICQLSDAAVEKLEEMGIEVREGDGKKEDQGFYVTCKSDYPIEAVNTEGDKIAGEMVGNGTTAAVAVTTYDWKFKGKEGRSLGIAKLVVKELEVFEGAEAIELSDEDLEGAL